MLKTRSDASVLYFKVLQILRVFTDTVEEFKDDLQELQHRCGDPSGTLWTDGFQHTYGHMDDVRKVLDHNWKVVLRRQNTASEGILKRLEKSKQEVLALRDGVSRARS